MEVLLSECGRSTPHSVIPDVTCFFCRLPKTLLGSSSQIAEIGRTHFRRSHCPETHVSWPLSESPRKCRSILYWERLAARRNSCLPILIVPSKSLATAVPRTSYFWLPSVIVPRKIAPSSDPSNGRSPFLLFTEPVTLSPSCLRDHCWLRMPSTVLWIVTPQFP